MRGTVRDGAGVPAPDASVRLERQGVSAVETETKSDGSFSFAGLSPGTYAVTAEKAGKRSPPASVVIPLPHDRGLELTLSVSAASQPASSSSDSLTGPMEFADKPDFTIAAVTDWTAAGGHGSDKTLRTSEALNRETITLKLNKIAPDAAQPHENEQDLHAALSRDPGNFETNHKLGELYLRDEKFADAVPLLQTASKINPDNFENEYDLALALTGAGELAEAHRRVNHLLDRNENAEVHRLAGELDEKLNDPLAAVHQFERAVTEDPSEQNYFEWGSELLLHRAVWQARDVFAAGVKAYPKSPRMLTALGAALFAGALYDESAQRLCEASDLNPADPEPYLFMGKIEMASPNPLACVEQKLARFVELRPQDPLANYFYAMTVWKQKGKSVDPQTLERVQGLLTKAVTIDPRCSDAYLQLGVLEATRLDFQKAIGFYSRAIEANPRMSEAHYRLGVAYDRTGNHEKARQEFQLHDEIEKQQAAAVEKQRREVKQFLVVNGKTPDSTPQ